MKLTVAIEVIILHNLQVMAIRDKKHTVPTTVIIILKVVIILTNG